MSAEEIMRYEASYVNSDASPPSSPLPTPTAPVHKKRRVVARKGKPKKLAFTHKNEDGSESLVPPLKIKKAEQQVGRPTTANLQGEMGEEKRILHQIAVPNSDLQMTIYKSKIASVKLAQLEM